MYDVDNLICWKCGAKLDDLVQPLARDAECPGCRADLHVCRLCAFYDTHAANACRETIADKVQDKTRANFCGYFQAQPNAWQAGGNEPVQSARAKLDELFGDAEGMTDKPENADNDLARLQDLFGSDKDNK